MQQRKQWATVARAEVDDASDNFQDGRHRAETGAAAADDTVFGDADEQHGVAQLPSWTVAEVQVQAPVANHQTTPRPLPRHSRHHLRERLTGHCSEQPSSTAEVSQAQRSDVDLKQQPD